MSAAIRRFVAIVLAVEVVVCGWLVGSRMLRPKAAIPASFPDDPLLAGEFADLAKRAENGGASDWLFLGESLTPGIVLGGLLVVTGVAISTT